MDRQLIARPTLMGKVKASRLAPRNTIKWDNLNLDLRPDFLPPRISNMCEARDRLKDILNQRDIRYSALERFLGDNGLKLSQEESDIDAVNVFFSENVYANEQATDIHLNWVYFIWSYGLFLGDTAIAQAAPYRKLKWKAENVAVSKLGESLRIVFEIRGYVSDPISFWPDSIMFSAGRFMLCADEDDPTEDGRYLNPLKRFNGGLARSLHFAKIV